MRRALRVALVALGIVAALSASLVVGLMVIGEFWPGLLEGKPPQIAAGLSFDATHDRQLSTQFDGIVKKRFSIGSSERILRDTLIGQGFRPNDDLKMCSGHAGREVRRDGMTIECPTADPARFLEYNWGPLACNHWLTVYWSGDANGNVTKIDGEYTYRCI